MNLSETVRPAEFFNFVFKLFLKIFLDIVEFEMMWTSLFCFIRV